MSTEHIIHLASHIRAAAGRVTVSGPDNWTQLLGIIQAAEAIIQEARREEADHG